MIDDARTVGAVDTIAADVCIVGAGPAGITLALELETSGLRVLLLESGGLTPDRDVQRLAGGTRSGVSYPPLEQARVRAFGGSSLHWPPQAMMARALEPLDFMERPDFPYSGWPFNHVDLAPYYQRARERCDVVGDDYSLTAWGGHHIGAGLALSADVAVTSAIPSAPIDVFVRAHHALRAAANVRVLLNATVTQIACDERTDEVRRVLVATGGEHRFCVRARHYVLAAGGIENPRLLLLGNARHPDGIGNRHGLVGRFFMEHLSIPTGFLVPSDPRLLSLTFYDLSASIESRWRAVITLQRALLEAEGLLNGSFFLEPRDRSGTSAGLAVEALRRFVRHRPLPPDLTAHARRVIRGGGHLLAPRLRRSKTGGDPVAFVIRSMSEQEPNPASRVTLSSRRDRLGLRLPNLEWRFSKRDVDSVRRSQASSPGKRSEPGWDISQAFSTTPLRSCPARGITSAPHGCTRIPGAA